MDINETDVISQEAVRRYFSILSKKGYYNYEDTNKIILLTAIQQMLNSDFVLFINECDKRVIERALNHLYCSICPITTPMYKKGVDIDVIEQSEDIY